jgi:hypothetical protein
MVWQLLLGCRACLLSYSRARTPAIAGTNICVAVGHDELWIYRPRLLMAPAQSVRSPPNSANLGQVRCELRFRLRASQAWMLVMAVSRLRDEDQQP